MDIQIRLVNPETDFPAIAELLTAIEPHPTTPEMLHEWNRFKPEGQTYRQAVAVDAQDRIIGYSVVTHMAWESPGHFQVWVAVHFHHRRHGLGTQLYDEACQLALASGATVLTSKVEVLCLSCWRFAERHGFRLERHIFDSTIDLAAFDESRFAGLIEAVEANGIRLTSLAEMGDTPENRRKLYDLNVQLSFEDPGSTGSFPSFEEFNQIWDTSVWFRPEGQFVALDGDQVVGLAAVGYFAETNSMYNLMTGVAAAYRGRKLAQALKLLSIRYAKVCGADSIRTNNDSQNGPMLAINRKFGYQPRPGTYRMIKNLPQEG